LLTSFIDKICNNVEIEPSLQSLDNERFHLSSAVTSSEARLDIKAGGFWARGVAAFFYVRVTHVNSKCYQSSKHWARIASKFVEIFSYSVGWFLIFCRLWIYEIKMILWKYSECTNQLIVDLNRVTLRSYELCQGYPTVFFTTNIWFR